MRPIGNKIESSKIYETLLKLRNLLDIYKIKSLNISKVQDILDTIL